MADLLKPIQADDWQGKSTGSGSTLIREKLLKRFSPTDFVKVINIDDEPYQWQYLPAQSEQISFDSNTSTVPMKFVHRDPPEVYLLEPQQTAIIVGANALLMVEGLVKKLMVSEALRRVPTLPPGQARQFGFTDDIKQEQLIDMIYLGKQFPGQDDVEAQPKDTIDEDLGLNDGRPRIAKPRPKVA